ncbi:thiamine biosynthesis lipoprotein [Arthrobacter ginsengisoli]|uniref:FAD:protein FMN transferase n=1 Tax=Arthrobacter ginsengisoli TaxID=1356565 RepID=A0ABU1UAG7_9MICC|nr:FAD:protein FMN transferase [Arthrobacter ginsengisoli]MDR7082171.1 thiamine biosynthesis lipoprotein [Arthrobacter ginsengisoli]
MGTVISLALPAGANSTPDGGLVLEGAAAAVEHVFTGLDEMFSLYRPDSEASRLARGEVTLRDASAAFRARFEDATGWRLLTEGFFTPERPDGVLDLSGIIKGYAIDQAASALECAGVEDWCLNAGGDVLVSGSPAPGTATPWMAGIVDPQDRGTLLSGFPLGGNGSFVALATSGTAERGDHIWRAGVGRTEFRRTEFRQVSVAATDIVTADVLATAVVAGGRRMLDWATNSWDVEVLAVLGNGELLATPGFRA